MGSPLPQGPSISSDMKYCAGCGKQMPRVADFCPHCGCRQSPPPRNETSSILGQLGSGLGTVVGPVVQHFGWKRVKLLFWLLIRFLALTGTVLFVEEWEKTDDFLRAVEYFDGLGIWLIPYAVLLIGYIRWVYKGNHDKRKWIAFPAVVLAICLLVIVGRQIHRFLQPLPEKVVVKAGVQCVTELNGNTHCDHPRMNRLTGVFIMLRQCSAQELIAGKTTCWDDEPVPPPKLVNGDASWSAKPGESEGEVRVNPNDGQKYVWVPPGNFEMGCSPGDDECNANERPSHKVTFTHGFWTGQTPVTVGAYERFARITGLAMPIVMQLPSPAWRNPAMPVVNVIWDEAEEYCAWAGARLPTEAEWEYAARAGSTEARYGQLDDIAWYGDNSGRAQLNSHQEWVVDQAHYFKRLLDNGNGMHVVGQKRANGFGFYDILGNVWEWVTDRYDPNYYVNSPSVNPQGPASGEYRVLRGGSWADVPSALRVSYRTGSDPVARNPVTGFRCGGEMLATPSPASDLPVETKPAPRMHWGMSKEEVRQIEEALPHDAIIEPNEVGVDYLIYRDDSAQISRRTCYYFTDGKLVEIREDVEDGYMPSEYNDRLNEFTKKFGQPVKQDVELRPEKPDARLNSPPVKSVTFVSPDSVTLVVSYGNDKGEGPYSVISLDRTQPQLVAR